MIGTIPGDDLRLPGEHAAIFMAASLASVPEVVKKNFTSPAGSTSSNKRLNSALTVVA